MASLLRLSHRFLSRSAGSSRSVSLSAWRRVMEIKDEKDFRHRVLRSEVPVLVDFHAGWCGPCHSLDTVLRKVVSGREGKVELAKVDVEVMPALATQFGVTAVPSVMGVQQGAVVCQFVGLQDEQFVEDFADRLEAPSSRH